MIIIRKGSITEKVRKARTNYHMKEGFDWSKNNEAVKLTRLIQISCQLNDR